jgi:DNA-binding MarR family transcriptional regulator
MDRPLFDQEETAASDCSGAICRARCGGDRVRLTVGRHKCKLRKIALLHGDMGRGLGRCERDVLLLLAMYRKLVDCGLQKFDSGTSWERRWLVAAAEREPNGQHAQHIAAYHAGDIVELKRVRRETSFSAAVLSRALRNLSRKGLIWRHAADLELASPAGGARRMTKHVSLTAAGIAAAAKLSATKAKAD